MGSSSQLPWDLGAPVSVSDVDLPGSFRDLLLPQHLLTLREVGVPQSHPLHQPSGLGRRQGSLLKPCSHGRNQGGALLSGWVVCPHCMPSPSPDNSHIHCILRTPVEETGAFSPLPLSCNQRKPPSRARSPDTVHVISKWEQQLIKWSGSQLPGIELFSFQSSLESDR